MSTVYLIFFTPLPCWELRCVCCVALPQHSCHSLAQRLAPSCCPAELWWGSRSSWPADTLSDHNYNALHLLCVCVCVLPLRQCFPRLMISFIIQPLFIACHRVCLHSCFHIPCHLTLFEYHDGKRCLYFVFTASRFIYFSCDTALESVY